MLRAKLSKIYGMCARAQLRRLTKHRKLLAARGSSRARRLNARKPVVLRAFVSPATNAVLMLLRLVKDTHPAGDWSTAHACFAIGAYDMHVFAVSLNILM
jgi:hypothetical protein